MTDTPTTLRVIPEIRAVHLERLASTTPAETLYFATNFDLQGAAALRGVTRVGLLTAMVRLARSQADVLELPEPLWMRFLPKELCLAATWKVAGKLRRRRRRIVTYAMENNDFAALVGGRRRVPRLVVLAAGRVVGLYLSTAVDRICFATPASQRLYESFPGRGAGESRTTLELPSRNDSAEPFASSTAIFVGALEKRKGVLELLNAWRMVESAHPDAVLTVVGSGPLAPRVERWASERPSSRRVAGFRPRGEVRDLIAVSEVLVAPSVRDGRWREQVGLPLKEALAVGTRVVTTDETGLAAWLAEHGHPVVPARNGQVGAEALAEALVAALGVDTAETRERRMRDLPAEDARLTADAWLHRPF